MASFPLVRSPDRQWLSWNITPGADPRIDNPPVGARAPRRAVRRSETWIKRRCDNPGGKPCQERIPELFDSAHAARGGEWWQGRAYAAGAASAAKHSTTSPPSALSRSPRVDDFARRRQ